MHVELLVEPVGKPKDGAVVRKISLKECTLIAINLAHFGAHFIMLMEGRLAITRFSFGLASSEANAYTRPIPAPGTTQKRETSFSIMTILFFNLPQNYLGNVQQKSGFIHIEKD
jgi:hypothetical protein